MFVLDVSRSAAPTNTSTSFHWDPTDQLWIFVIDTRPLSTSHTYHYRIELNDGTNIQFQYGLK